MKKLQSKKMGSNIKKKNEILVFLALNILQGTVEKPDIEQYCSKRNSTSVPFFFFFKVMSYHHFQLIHWHLHFSDGSKFDATQLQKLWPVIKYLLIIEK